MKKSIILLSILFSTLSFGSTSTKYIGKTLNGKKCTLEYITEDKNQTNSTIAVKVKSKFKSSMGISMPLWRFKEEVDAIKHGNSEMIEFEKDGMSELCDVYDLCLFQKKLKVISVIYSTDNDLIGYEYKTQKDWISGAKFKSKIICTNLKPLGN